MRRFFRALTAPGWQRNLYIMFIAQTMTSVGFSSIFPFLPLYVEDLGSTSGLNIELLSGLVFSAQAMTMMFASPIWGMVADRHGRKLMVERAMFGGAILLAMMAFVRSAEELVLLRAIQGLVTGTISATYALIAAETPREKSGYAMGMLQVGSGAGVALGPLLGGAVADAVSYRAAFYITAAFLFLSGILVAVGVREHFTRPDPLTGQVRLRWTAQWRQLLALPGVGLVYGLRFLYTLGQNMLLPVLPLFLLVLLASDAQINTYTGLVVGVASATTTISAVYLGRLGDRTGHRRIMILSALLAAAAFLAQAWVQAGWQLLVLQGVVGVALGGLIPSSTALLTRYSPAGSEGVVYGLDSSIGSAARSIAPLVGSAIAVWASMRLAIAASGLIFLALGLIAAWLLPGRPPARPRR
jgi:DHA1 family multidrug resistance protein-like MFS transporter